ncbi:CDP-alcohol phosphatidyltransferase family protein [Skermanella pratensis]|uniref:CDP-alcohol phosphatidyltransferase family protein n=1 Tax=Skermanella pratensis TaxID=2233999 RepID=UPI001787B16E|nr:CDP-alcohol phosphatidyltransferase family protein [Skermanella pratensis]
MPAAARLVCSVALHTAVGAVLTAAAAVALGDLAGLPGIYPLTAMGFYAVMAVLLLLHLRGHAPHARFGAANRVTLLRGVIASLIGGTIPVVPHLSPEALWVVSLAALLALALDGVDGWVARRTRMASPYGKQLDINFDTVLMGILAVLAWQDGKAGAWVLAIGLARYGFVAAGWIWPMLNAELPFSQRRRVICVVQIAVLLACILPVVEPPLSSLAAAAALALLLFSFAVDTLWLVKAGADDRARTDRYRDGEPAASPTPTDI